MAPYSLLITRQTNRVSLSIENSKMNCKYFHGSSFAPYCSTLSFQLRGDTDKMLIGTMVPSTRTTWDRWSSLPLELYTLSTLLIFTQRWWWLDVGGCVFDIPVLMWTDSFFIYQYMFYNL